MAEHELPEVDPLTADVLGVLDRAVQAACAEIDRLRAREAELLAALELAAPYVPWHHRTKMIALIAKARSVS